MKIYIRSITRLISFYIGAPNFEMKTENITLTVGDRMRLRVPFTGIPRPEISWKKDDEDLKSLAAVVKHYKYY